MNESSKHSYCITLEKPKQPLILETKNYIGLTEPSNNTITENTYTKKTMLTQLPVTTTKYKSHVTTTLNLDYDKKGPFTLYFKVHTLSPHVGRRDITR